MRKQSYIPQRNDIIWIDYEPTKGKEIGKYRPALVLSEKQYNKKTGLIIICPISTSIRGALTEVPITNLDEPCVVASTLIHTFDWKQRKAQLITQAKPKVMDEVLLRLISLLGANDVINQHFKS